MAINPITLTCAPIEVFSATGASLGMGSSFLYSRDENWVNLVTNWHIVTGRNPNAPRESKRGAVPTKFRIKLHKKLEGIINPGILVAFEGDLNSEDGDNPEWQEHPTHKYKVDLVVIKIPYNDDFKTMVSCSFISELAFLEARFSPSVMDDVFVIGYPWGLTGGGEALPLYKRGSVASEPIIDQGGLPRFLIDCRTANAMSGSPVICSRKGIWSPTGELSDETYFDGVQNFAGIYSGRLLEAKSTGTNDSDREKEISEIGIVWKSKALSEIVNGGVPGSKLSELTA